MLGDVPERHRKHAVCDDGGTVASDTRLADTVMRMYISHVDFYFLRRG
jgi:hypothetical protein